MTKGVWMRLGAVLSIPAIIYGVGRLIESMGDGSVTQGEYLLLGVCGLIALAAVCMMLVIIGLIVWGIIHYVRTGKLLP